VTAVTSASRTRRRSKVGAVAVAVLVLAGCADRDTASPPASVADLAVDTAPAGTPLADGFVVAENSALVGEVFPVLRTQDPGAPRTGPQSGWTAQMVVLADPVGVFNDYIRQARDLGYDTQGGCTVSDGESNAVPLADYRGDEARLVTCHGVYYRTSERDPIDILRIAVDLYIGDVGGQPSATVDVSLAKVGDGSGDPSLNQSVPLLEQITERMPPLASVEVPELPVVGEPIAPLLSQRSAFLRVPPGSTLAALPARGARCSIGWEAILLTTDVAPVLKDLEDQLAPIIGRPVVRTQERRGAIAYTSFTVDPAGDDWIEVVAVQAAGSGTVLVSAC
jgi:hypothetical protein